MGLITMGIRAQDLERCDIRVWREPSHWRSSRGDKYFVQIESINATAGWSVDTYEDVAIVKAELMKVFQGSEWFSDVCGRLELMGYDGVAYRDI